MFFPPPSSRVSPVQLLLSPSIEDICACLLFRAEFQVYGAVFVKRKPKEDDHDDYRGNDHAEHGFVACLARGVIEAVN